MFYNKIKKIKIKFSRPWSMVIPDDYYIVTEFTVICSLICANIRINLSRIVQKIEHCHLLFNSNNRRLETKKKIRNRKHQ